jgi:hypothetical protein
MHHMTLSATADDAARDRTSRLDREPGGALAVGNPETREQPIPGDRVVACSG